MIARTFEIFDALLEIVDIVNASLGFVRTIKVKQGIELGDKPAKWPVYASPAPGKPESYSSVSKTPHSSSTFDDVQSSCVQSCEQSFAQRH